MSNRACIGCLGEPHSLRRTSVSEGDDDAWPFTSNEGVPALTSKAVPLGLVGDVVMLSMFGTMWSGIRELWQSAHKGFDGHRSMARVVEKKTHVQTREIRRD